MYIAVVNIETLVSKFILINLSMNKYIAYYRVSTTEQGKSGLGLEAQERDVLNYISKTDGELVASFTEVESGKNNNREELRNALDKAKELNAVLVIAKLDRLSRNAAFIFTLKDSGVEFVCVDMPQANNLTIGIMSVLAQDERERISERTKKALASLKAQGVKLGSPVGFTKESRAKANETKRKNAARNINSNRSKKAITQMIRLAKLDKENLTKESIADELNEQGFTTTRGKKFCANNVRYLLNQVLGELSLSTLPKY